MSGRQPDRGRGRGGRGRGDAGSAGRGRGAQFSVPTHESRGGRGGRGDGGGGGYGGGGGGGYRGGGGRGRGASAPKEIFSHGSGDNLQPSLQVQKIENEIIKAAKPTSGPGKALTMQPLPRRPGFGTQGKAVTLWANYFEMAAPMDLTLFRYSVEIRPDEAGKVPAGKRAKRIIGLLIEEHFTQAQNEIATDHKANLISRSELAINGGEYTVRYRSEDEDEPLQNAKTYRLLLQSTGTFLVSELIDYLTSGHASTLFGSKEEIIQALNIVMGHYPKTATHIFSVGANKHFETNPAFSEKMSLGAGLQAIRGFFVSVRSATSRILLNVQVKHAACYEDGPLGRLMSTYLAQNGWNMVRLGNFLHHVRVQVTHIIRKNKAGSDVPRIKTIAGLAMPGDGRDLQHPPKVRKFGAGSKEVEFFLANREDQPGGSQPSPAQKGKKGKKPAKAGPEPSVGGGRYISVYDFFRVTYNTTIQDENMPVINVGTRQNPSYLPPDVCIVVPGQPCNTKLTPGQTQQMIKFAVRRPAENARSIVINGARLLGINPAINTTLSEYGLGITPRLITVPGRVLMGPSVKYRANKSASTMFGSWNMREVKFSEGSTLSSWTYLWLATSSRNELEIENQLHPVLSAFQSKLREVGVEAPNFLPGLQVTLDPDNVDVGIDQAIHRFATSAKRAPPKLVLVIIPSVDASIYNRVKFACDVKEGILNVCTIATKLMKPNNDQYFANVALKFNLKLGGRNQYLENAKLGIISEGKTMIVGIDVTHPSPGSASKAPSVAGIVASVDQWLGQWPADMRIQPVARQEMVADLDGMLKSRLRLWMKKNKGQLPENILIYRDGVSEGQYNLVLNQELPLLRKACREVYPATDTKKGLPRLSIIIVGKRHNTRFYPTREDDADRSSNPQNGTVVDRGVTEVRNWDFYLQAHTALQGTARPAHYFAVLDEIFSSRKTQLPFQNAADVVEDLTHNMCYLFGRATKAVSICPPAYYADLVCERARCYLSKLFDASPGATSGGSVSEGGGGGSEPDPSHVRIHENVRDSMFYI